MSPMLNDPEKAVGKLCQLVRYFRSLTLTRSRLHFRDHGQMNTQVLKLRM